MSTAELTAKLTALREAEDEQLLQHLAPHFGAGLRDLQGYHRTPRLVAARRALVWLLRREHHWTNRRIASALKWPLRRVERHGQRKY